MPISSLPLYRDSNQAVPARVEDLLHRMTLHEKAGLLFHTMVMIRPDGTWVSDPEQAPAAPPHTMVDALAMNHFSVLGATSPRQMAERHNELQDMAADTRLGIPVTLSTDPRHAFSNNPAAAMMAGPFSQWPESLGLAAAGDTDLVRRFADTVRLEYLAVGLRVALHPQIDLATEPRWARAGGTFGEDAELTSRLVSAYIEGLRGPGGTLGRDSVAAMVKHFPGGGPQKDGEDPHFPYGREQVYPGDRFDYHLQPFRAALAAGCTQVMPYYGMPVGTEHEEIAFGFNKGIISGLLRERLGFEGIVCTDWGLISDTEFMGHTVPARAWGAEHLSESERVRRALEAGVDQFGGEHRPELVVELVEAGLVTEDRVDASVRRLLSEKFHLGLFDERRHVDPAEAEETVGAAGFRAEGARAQRRAVTVLKNDGRLLPLSGRPRLYVEGVRPDAVAEYADLVDDPAHADLALLRVETPYEPRTGMFEQFFHAGRLDFAEDRLAEILAVLDKVPTVVAIDMDRPAVIPEIAARAGAVLALFGAADSALLDVVFGRAQAEGRLPFQLPRSMEQVRNGRSDVPQECSDPVFAFGDGLRLTD
ncbi:glycoside hydrolase family 3 protein [Streptomyces sp. NPDC048438]|uniref:glycoside hydrolase family 3 protein n=1 Tax=Streptomyces sp. NPDC048438 TaxID=3365551 RepID=UPI00371BFD65